MNEEIEGLKLPIELGNGYSLEQALCGIALAYEGKLLPYQTGVILETKVDHVFTMTVKISLLPAATQDDEQKENHKRRTTMSKNTITIDRDIMDVTRPNPQLWYHRLFGIDPGTYTEEFVGNVSVETAQEEPTDD
ncbi:hypothetical protein LCGC14_1323910 [marine sediment metagenome]|uniref:Uncharacterized protein n=1 Tax=marine sediment metagenome TaxID=412755 RepID=A0A0F9L494_9ZZZZ